MTCDSDVGKHIDFQVFPAVYFFSIIYGAGCTQHRCHVPCTLLKKRVNCWLRNVLLEQSCLWSGTVLSTSVSLSIDLQVVTCWILSCSTWNAVDRQHAFLLRHCVSRSRVIRGLTLCCTKVNFIIPQSAMFPVHTEFLLEHSISIEK